MVRRNSSERGVQILQIPRRRVHGEGLRLRFRVRNCHASGLCVYRADAGSVPGVLFGVVLRAADSGGAGGSRDWSMGNGD